MSKDNGAMPTYVSENYFSEDLKQMFNAEATKLDPYSATPPFLTLSDQNADVHLNNVIIPSTIPAKNYSEQNIGYVETRNYTSNDDSNDTGATQLPFDDTKPNPKDPATAFVDPSFNNIDFNPEDINNDTINEISSHDISSNDKQVATDNIFSNSSGIHITFDDTNPEIRTIHIALDNIMPNEVEYAPITLDDITSKCQDVASDDAGPNRRNIQIISENIHSEIRTINQNLHCASPKVLSLREDKSDLKAECGVMRMA